MAFDVSLKDVNNNSKQILDLEKKRTLSVIFKNSGTNTLVRSDYEIQAGWHYLFKSFHSETHLYLSNKN